MTEKLFLLDTVIVIFPNNDFTSLVYGKCLAYQTAASITLFSYFSENLILNLNLNLGFSEHTLKM